MTTVRNDKSVVAEIETTIGRIRITFKEKSTMFEFPKSNCCLEAVSYKDKPTVNEYRDNELICGYRGFNYNVKVNNADCVVMNNSYIIKPNESIFELHFE